MLRLLSVITSLEVNKIRIGFSQFYIDKSLLDGILKLIVQINY
jgi:hypothetical protein